MKHLSKGQRVLVKAVGEFHWRLRMQDNAAWVALDHRLDDRFHPFPADDATRSTHVLTYPEDCEEAK
jgi:hypothetical protein